MFFSSPCWFITQLSADALLMQNAGLDRMKPSCPGQARALIRKGSVARNELGSVFILGAVYRRPRETRTPFFNGRASQRFSFGLAKGRMFLILGISIATGP